jgi:predicted dehydrogenase
MKKCVLIGASGRGYGMYLQSIAGAFAEYAKMVAVMDPNGLRAQAVVDLAKLDCPTFTDFDTMVAQAKPDTAIITTVDRYHSDYVVKCLDAGIDVICEKPMTIDGPRCSEILEAERRNNRRIIVTFNVRFMPYVAAVKKLLMDGAVGDILSVDLEWLLDRSHGASYFRRWHSIIANSGGLLVHKATHHFDMLNWWIADEPAEVMAFGKLNVYGRDPGKRGWHCGTCEDRCSYYTDLSANPTAKRMYIDCCSVDGYLPDRCIWSDEIDIYDTMSVNVKYRNGVALSYSLNAHCPYEGWKVSINGTQGRLEAAAYYSGLRRNDPADYISIFDTDGRKIEHTIPKAGGSHGGGDERMLRMILVGGIEDPLGQMASSYDGALSVLIGAAANKSIAEGCNVRINDLVPLDKYRGS